MTGRLADAGVWAVVPSKGFRRAKTRLAPLLDQDERADLACAMLGDVLDVLKRAPGVAGVLVVAGDMDVAAVAERNGAVTLADPVEAGTNAAVKRGLQHLTDIGAGRCVVVQADIPFLSGQEFASVLSALERNPLVIAPAKRDGGTNILALARPDLIVPAFGPDSFARHLRAASSLGIEAAVLTLRGAGHDIDVPSDLDDCPESGTGPRTRALLMRRSHTVPAVARSFEEIFPT